MDTHKDILNTCLYILIIHTRNKYKCRASSSARPLCFHVSAQLRQNRGFPESMCEVEHLFHQGT